MIDWLGWAALLSLVSSYFLLEFGAGRLLRFVFSDLVDWIAKQVIKQNPDL